MINVGCKKSSDNSSPGGATLPVLTTSVVSNIHSTSASCGGNISSDGVATITARGVCLSTSHNPTIANGKTSDGTGTGTFTSNILGLSPSTSYYVRAYAINNAGAGYGAETNFTTLPATPGTVTD